MFQCSIRNGTFSALTAATDPQPSIASLADRGRPPIFRAPPRRLIQSAAPSRQNVTWCLSPRLDSRSPLAQHLYMQIRHFCLLSNHASWRPGKTRSFAARVPTTHTLAIKCMPAPSLYSCKRPRGWWSTSVSRLYVELEAICVKEGRAAFCVSLTSLLLLLHHLYVSPRSSSVYIREPQGFLCRLSYFLCRSATFLHLARLSSIPLSRVSFGIFLSPLSTAGRCQSLYVLLQT